jgi:hypothetical protein
VGAWLALLAACAPIPVDVAVPEPVTIDVNMKVDVVTRQDQKSTQKQQSEMEAAVQRRKRMSEVQGLKNDRIIGENREGYLDIVRPPDNPDYLKYAEQLVEAENNDRATIYLSAAQQQGKSMELVETDYAKLWRERAFPGEWIERDDGAWVQK